MGKCALCHNLTEHKIIVDAEAYESCVCTKGKFNNNGSTGFFTRKAILKPSKQVAELEESCGDWDDALKAKVVDEKEKEH